MSSTRLPQTRTTEPGSPTDSPAGSSLPSDATAAPGSPASLSGPADPATSDPQAEVARHRAPARNFATMVMYQVLMRIGWIFKTESIIMPAVLDTLGGAAWLRGCLPLLNRFGQSIPPLLMARRITVVAHKKYILMTCTGLMALCFAALSAIWYFSGSVTYNWMPGVFLAFYAVFFMSTGVNLLTMSTTQGKLIPVTLRGRLMLVANVLGASGAIACAWYFLPGWLAMGQSGFTLIFGFSAVSFAGAAICAWVLDEPADDFRRPVQTVRVVFAKAWETIYDRHDGNFRCLALVTCLFGVTVMLFPHYQALGRQQLGLELSDIMWWVVVQNAGTAMFSIFVGPLADRRGNRLVLRLVILGVTAAPLAAVILAHSGTLGVRLYPIVFLLVGLTPVAIRSFHNYTLEISEPSEHPRYLSALSLCLAAPVILSPLVGWLVDLVGFEPVFLGADLLVLLAFALTFRLKEPRSTSHPDPSDVVDVTDE